MTSDFSIVNRHWTISRYCQYRADRSVFPQAYPHQRVLRLRELPGAPVFENELQHVWRQCQPSVRAGAI